MELTSQDLAKSGLIPSDINARALESPERAATIVPHSIQGYVIPYFQLDGRPLAHYRVRLFDFDPKYKQPKDASNYVYYPKNFLAVSQLKPYILIVEGEKKAACAVKMGFPAIALGGVDSWRNRLITLPSNAELTQNKSNISAKLPAGAEVNEDAQGSLAIGMQELIDYALKFDKHIIFAYDTDGNHVKSQVQRAAAACAFELRFRGINFNRLRQIVLPNAHFDLSKPITHKVGLDDFLTSPRGPEMLQRLIVDVLKQRSAFPQHPAIRDFINKRLQRHRLSRKETQALSIGVLSDMDANGIRLRSTQALQTYYFDQKSRQLLKAEFNRPADFHDTKFGQFLYRAYGLSSADSRLNEWLAAQFTGEDPVGEVSPHRIIARTSSRVDSVIYQLSDAQYAKVSSQGLTIHSNGEEGILFESEQVEPVDVQRLQQEYERQLANTPEGKSIRPFWIDVLSTVRLKDQQKQKFVTGLLYYMSPWLYRWRGMQLPVEMIIGESGSGKSTLCELRLCIISGQPRLRNSPQDLKDWHASIANSGGLHVTDNVQLVDRSLRQRLSDEICRIITEPAPSIEMRKYYTHADLVRIPVNAVFAVTAIQQPFQNADIIQRSIITELDKLGKIDPLDDNPIIIRYDGEWRNQQLAKYNGREGWLAHHFLVLQRFFQLVKEKWNNNYQAKHRLINFEQSMMLMAEVLGIDASWIPEYLAGTTDRALSESDWAFEGLKNFIDNHAHFYGDKPISSQTIADWATTQEDYQKCEILTNTRKLSRYLNIHKTMVASSLGIIDMGTKNNRQVYRISRPKQVV